jgi:glycosyltransferase involved in cell wall biosynthesis
MALARRPVRVTHLVHAFEGGGLESLVGAMVKSFDRARVTTSVVSLSGSIGRLGEALKAEVDQMLAIRPTPVVSLVAPVGIVRALRQTRPDVIHAHSGVWFKASLSARLLGKPLIFTEHGREHDDPPFGRWISHQASRSTAAVVAVSARLEEYMHARIGVPRNRLMTIENGVDTDRFSPVTDRSAVRESFGLPADALVVGSVGRLEPVKAYDRLVRSLAAVRDAELPARVFLLLCGDGSQRGPLEELARSLGVADLVRFPGWVSDPVNAYRAMDVFALPSLSEGLSVSLLEAMASGAVPLVTPVGANNDVLGDGLASQVVPAEDLTRFSAALEEILLSRDRRREMAATARSIVVTRFSQARMIEAYTLLYERLAGTSMS